MGILGKLKSVGKFLGRTAPAVLSRGEIKAGISLLPWGGLVNVLTDTVAQAQAEFPEKGRGDSRNAYSIAMINAALGAILTEFEKASGKRLPKEDLVKFAGAVVQAKDAMVTIAKLFDKLKSEPSTSPAPPAA
jgi:hypothetical protein